MFKARKARGFAHDCIRKTMLDQRHLDGPLVDRFLATVLPKQRAHQTDRLCAMVAGFHLAAGDGC